MNEFHLYVIHKLGNTVNVDIIEYRIMVTVSHIQGTSCSQDLGDPVRTDFIRIVDSGINAP